MRHLIRFAFTLRALMAAVLLFGIYFAFLNRFETRRQAMLESIQRAGGSITISDEMGFTLFDSQRVESIWLPPNAKPDVEPSELAVFSNLEHVLFTTPDAQLYAIAPDNLVEMKSLPDLTVYTTTDDFLDQLRSEFVQGVR